MMVSGSSPSIVARIPVDDPPMRLARIIQTMVRGALRLPGRRVRWKIMLPYTVLSLLVPVAGTYFEILRMADNEDTLHRP